VKNLSFAELEGRLLGKLTYITLGARILRD